MSAVREDLLHYWYQALSTEHGIELACSDAESARTRLLTLRKEIKDTDLDQIVTCISPFDPTRLWLRKKNATP